MAFRRLGVSKTLSKPRLRYQYTAVASLLYQSYQIIPLSHRFQTVLFVSHF
jgi:hypothetical protein